MNKGFWAVLVVFLVGCGNNQPLEEKKAALVALSGKSVNTNAFNQSFSHFLATYYGLKDAFVQEDLKAIDVAADSLMVHLAAIPFNDISSDSVRKSAGILVESMQAELKGLKGESVILEKRKAFQLLGEQLIALIGSVQYDAEVIYHQYCPMAMDDQGASWLSKTAAIQNPYLPTTMLECGEVKDTINNPLK